MLLYADVFPLLQVAHLKCNSYAFNITFRKIFHSKYWRTHRIYRRGHNYLSRCFIKFPRVHISNRQAVQMKQTHLNGRNRVIVIKSTTETAITRATMAQYVWKTRIRLLLAKGNKNKIDNKELIGLDFIRNSGTFSAPTSRSAHYWMNWKSDSFYAWALKRESVQSFSINFIPAVVDYPLLKYK